MTEIPPPILVWRENTPHAEAFGDLYYTENDGLAEAQHVFLRGNGLPERLAQAQSTFTLGETGFGTGLNFLALWQMWEALPEPRPRLHFITTELHPLTPQDISRAHQPWPALKSYSEALIAAYPPAIAGAHRRWLADGNIQIDFLWGDAATMLAAYQPAAGEITVDAWFLDGFAPSKNPAMWQPSLYAAMAKLSAPRATLSSFTSAGEVRRGLQSAGFTIRKERGYGRKREMIVGEFSAQSSLPSSTPQAKTAVVIGAGIAGVMSAWRLAKQGYHVDLLDGVPHACAGASGNPASAFTPYYTPEWNPRSRALMNGFATMRHIVDYLKSTGHSLRHNIDGMLMLDLGDASDRTKRFVKWQQSLTLPPEIRRTLSPAEASEFAGTPLPYGGWFYPQGGWLNMGDICRALLTDAGESTITTHYSTTIERLEYQGETWHAAATNGQTFSAPVVVLANGYAAKKLLPELPINVVHGQSITFTAPPAWQIPHYPLHASHTLIPLGDGRLHWGSSFSHRHSTAEILPEITAMLLDDLHAAFPSLDIPAISETIEPWAGLRCTHPSRAPLIGQAQGQPKGLYLHLAHGARGTLSAGLAFGSGG